MLPKMESRNFVLLFLSALAAMITTSHQQQCVMNLDLILVVDGSNSIGEGDFEIQRAAMISLVNRSSISESEINVGIVLFSSDVKTIVELTGDKNKIITAIQNMEYPDEETRTHLAIDTAVAMFDQYGRNGTVPRLMIVVTDGAPTEPEKTVISADKAKSKGINIFCIGVTKRADEAEMRKIASTKNQVFIAQDFTVLEDSLNNATYRACVDLKCQEATIDIVFVLDSSSTVGATNFLEMKKFVFEFLLFAEIDGGKIRVAVVTFGDEANVSFHLNAYGSKSAMTTAINNLQYRPGGTNIVDALRLLRTNVFTKSKGDRGDAPNIAILLSANDDNVNASLAADEADKTRAASIQFYGVGIGHSSTNLLDGIVSRPLEENRFMISSFSELNSLVPEVYNKFNRFCENPPPVPACFMGITDIWFVVDVSRTAEVLSRVQYTGDFAKLKDGLIKMVEIVQDPSVNNSEVNLGFIAYSDTSMILADPNQFSSVNVTASAVRELPAGISQGGASLIPALQNIVTPPVVSNYRSYVAIVAPESSLTSNPSSLSSEFTRLKKLGYTIAIFVVSENGTLNLQALQTDASGPRYFYYLPRYSQLEAATKNFTRDRLCAAADDDTTGLCADSGHREDGVGTVGHPVDCDKYIQCYYDERNDVDLGVVRQCSSGLHFNAANKTCSKPSDAGCAYDRCKESCEPYKMAGSCRAYWDCESGVSTPKCCPENYAFISGVGCQPDTSCKDPCGPTKSCGACQKKPNWQNPSGYDVKILGGNTWVPRPCFYDDFDIVDCDCSVPRDQTCPADRVFDFTDVKTVTAIEEGTLQSIRVYDVTKNSQGIVLGNRSAVHVSVNRREDGSEPFALEFRFRELEAFSPYGETLVSSGLTCGNGNSLLVAANDEYIFAEVRSAHAPLAEVKVPTKGLNTDEFKTLVLSYEKGVLALSISDGTTHYIAKTEAPSSICLACGLDLGRGVNKLSFDGELQKIAVYSCAWPLLY